MQKKEMDNESGEESSLESKQSVFDEEDYSDDSKVEDNEDEKENYSSESVDETGNEDCDNESLSSEVDESVEEVESDDYDRILNCHKENNSELEEEESDDRSSSDSSSSGIIPLHGALAIGHAADDHEVILMERVSPEPGM